MAPSPGETRHGKEISTQAPIGGAIIDSDPGDEQDDFVNAPNDAPAIVEGDLEDVDDHGDEDDDEDGDSGTT